MKLDIEEREKEVLFDLINSGAIVELDHIYIDWHGSALVPGFEDYNLLASFFGGDNIALFVKDFLKTFYEMKLKKFQYDRITNIDDTDDESYSDYRESFPEC